MMPTKPQVLLAFADSNAAEPLRNLAPENKAIREALDPLVRKGELVEPTTLWNATPDDIADEFQKDYKQFRAFHFGGHANGAAVILADLRGARAEGHAKGLADFLGQQQGLELVVLNGCSTQAQIDRLHAAGVKAVIATTRAILDGVAVDFAARLYKGLVDQPLGRAFAEASGALRLKEGEPGVSRTLVDDERVDPEGWTHDMPWTLSCSEALKGWRLVPMAVFDEKEVIDVLADVVSNPDDAKIVTERAGVPTRLVPIFSNSFRYWETVVKEVGKGTTGREVEGLLDEALALYPYNKRLLKLRHG